MNNPRVTLVYYFSEVFKAAGLKWNHDNSTEIKSAVDAIVEEAKRAAIVGEARTVVPAKYSATGAEKRAHDRVISELLAKSSASPSPFKKIKFTVCHDGDRSTGIDGDEATVEMNVDTSDAAHLRFVKNVLKGAFDSLWDFRAQVYTEYELQAAEKEEE